MSNWERHWMIYNLLLKKERKKMIIDEYNDYRDLTDKEAKNILEQFIHTEFFDRRDTKEGKAIIRCILALDNLIQNDRQKKITS